MLYAALKRRSSTVVLAADAPSIQEQEQEQRQRQRAGAPALLKINVKVKIKVKGNGQECPFHTYASLCLSAGYRQSLSVRKINQKRLAISLVL
jgi:hypothetical protein